MYELQPTSLGTHAFGPNHHTNVATCAMDSSVQNPSSIGHYESVYVSH